VAGNLEVRRFVFVNEMSTNTSLLSMDGCRGRQAHFHTPSAIPGATLSTVALAYWANGYHKRSSPPGKGERCREHPGGERKYAI